MKNNAQLRLHFQLILPVMLVLVTFGIIIDTVWGPSLLEREKAKIIDREEDVLRNMLPGLAQDLFASDLGALYGTLRHLELTNSDEAMVAHLYGAKGERLYPLTAQPIESDHKHHLLISSTIMLGNQRLGRIELSIDAQDELEEVSEHIASLEQLIVATGAAALLLLLALYYWGIGRPILLLIKATERIAKGDLTTPIPNHAARAVGGLGSAFIHMQTQLSRSNAQLEQAFREANDNSTRYSTVLESIPGALLVINQQGRIEDINQAAEEIFGYNKGEIIDQPCLHLFPGEQCAAEMADSFSADPSQTLESEKEGMRKDGSLVPLQLYRRTMHLAGEVKLVLIAIDITQIIETNQQLLIAIDQAEKASRAKSAFLSRMSHELRTPLNAIIGFGQLLALDEQMQGATQRENVAEIVYAGEHLLQLVDEVLDLSSIEDGRIDLNPEPLGIGASIHRVINQLRPLAQKRRIEMEAVLPSADVPVTADRGRLAQLLINLISNAIKYNHEGGRVRVELSLAEAAGKVRVNITDTGPGIAPDDQQRLFRPFERLESPYEAIDGTGIGLALSKRLVEAMDGQIGVTSTPGQGSTFWFELPKAGGKGLATNTTTLKKVLYIEDNPANMRLMAKFAGMRGDIEFLQSPTAEQGLELAARESPALILMDINLPGMNGFEALERIKQMSAIRKTAVIAVTANAMRDDIHRIESSEFADYMIKPIALSQFNELLDRYLSAEQREATGGKA